MSFVDTAREVIRRAGSPVDPAANRTQADEEGREMHTSGGNDSAEAYLNTLPADIIMKLQTLMFVGKDKHLNFPKVYEELKPLTRDKEEAIRAMTSKVSLAEYLQKGLEIAIQQGVNLEAEF